MNGLRNPKGFLFAGVIIILSGLAFNHFLGMRGELNLVAGETKTLITNTDGVAAQKQNQSGLGWMITLDSLRIRSYTPIFELLTFGPDTSSTTSTKGKGPLIDKFPAELMKIRRVGETDYYFRLKAFYPNFQFAYEYPTVRDTIEPKAPGITLELKTTEGMPIVTLRTDQPNKHTLGDIVSLGAPLYFFWENAADSIKALDSHKGETENMVVFSGADQKVIFIGRDTFIEQPLKEGVFYKMPGQDTVGFTILYSFPDYAYLKAVPSTKGTEILNPVAHVEVWKAGEGYRDAFLYPQRRGRLGGEYAIPESGYTLGLGEVKAESVKHCDCYVSIQADTGKAPKLLTLFSGKSKAFKGLRFTPIECIDGRKQMLNIGVRKTPGNFQIIAGVAILFLTFIYMVFRGKPRSH